ncbi:MAG: hypothetical protein P1U63_00400 [Coxiellaceae bacterium]|nr:hypothetical protein [Coxiellaceae bacterium]
MIRLRSARSFFLISSCLAAALAWVTLDSLWSWWLQLMVIAVVLGCWLHFQLMHSWRIWPTAVVAMFIDSHGDLWLKCRNGYLACHKCLPGSCHTRGLACVAYSNDHNKQQAWLLVNLRQLSSLQRSRLIWQIKYEISDVSLDLYQKSQYR